MFSTSEKYYDEIYAAIGKDYIAETNKVHKFIQKYKRTDGNTLLDVACGTGVHAGILSKYYTVEGLDLDAKMLAIARRKHPKIRFHQGDMIRFDLGCRFDVVVCLFSAIGYVKTKAKLRQAIKTMAKHLLPGGVLLVEPWFAPEQWETRRASMIQVSQPDLKLVRMGYSGQKGRVSFLEFQYLVGTPKGIKHSIEQHTLGLFTLEEYTEAFHAAGLKVIHDKKGLDGRGLYIGRNPIK